MRATTVFNRLLRLRGTRVCGVSFESDAMVVTVALRRARLHCPGCSYRTRARYDTRPVESVWRHLDVCGWRCRLRARLRRLDCPSCGVRTEAVPFAAAGSGFTAEFEALVAWLVPRTDKTSVQLFARIAWRTVGAICARVSSEALDPDRLCGLVDIGVDEVSWRKHHRYLTLVSDHHTGTIVWGAPGRDAATLDEFFTECPDGGESIEAVSMDLGPAYAKSVRNNAPQAVRCFDPFHVVQLGTDALEQVRRRGWQAARELPDQAIAKRFKGARWALLKNPGDLTATQADTLARVKHDGGQLWRAYQLKEALRAVFAGDLDPTSAEHLLDRWCARAQRSRINEFVTAARTIRKNRTGIQAALQRRLSNGRHEGLNNKIRTMTRRAYGFHSPEATLGLVMLTCGPVHIELPHK